MAGSDSKDTKLMVFAHLGTAWAPCGQLVLTEEADRLLASSFAYGLNYLKRSDALEVDPVSLSLADREAVRAKRLLPANRLPFFGGIRDAAPDALGRSVIEAKLKATANSLPESQYLLHAGGERVGALDIRRDLHDSPTAGASAWHTLAHLLEAAERIDEGHSIPAHLEAILVDGTVLGGARPKASIRDDAGVLWLSKFANRHDAFDIPAIECAALHLARLAGLTIPPARTVILGDRRVMLIRRFDRYWAAPNATPAPDADLLATAPINGATEHRMGFISGLTLAGCGESESRTQSYADLAESLRCHSAVIRKNTAELFKRMIFNIFVSNDDNHLRNHGVLWDLCLPGWRRSTTDLPRTNASRCRGAAACELIDEVWRVVRQWRVYLTEAGVPATEQDKIAPAFRHIDDVSTAALRKLLP